MIRPKRRRTMVLMLMKGTVNIPQHLVTLSHISTRVYSDVIHVYIGGGVNIGVFWFWDVHGIVNIVDTSYYEGQGYDYGDLFDAFKKLGYTAESAIVTETETELQEMVNIAREAIGLPIEA